MRKRNLLEINGKIHEVIGGSRLRLITVADLIVTVNAVLVQHV